MNIKAKPKYNNNNNNFIQEICIITIIIKSRKKKKIGLARAVFNEKCEEAP